MKTLLISKLLGIMSDEEKRNRLIIAVVMVISLFIAIIFLPLFIILYPLETLKLFFARRKLYRCRSITQ